MCGSEGSHSLQESTSDSDAVLLSWEAPIYCDRELKLFQHT